MLKLKITALSAVLAILFASCSGGKTAQIWTDCPELAFYAEYFNTVQDQYKVTVRFFEYPAAQLANSAAVPDIIIGRWLKNSSTGANFRSIDDMFGAQKLSRSVFYSKLLAIGRIELKQYLLPVSYNIPAMIFSKNSLYETSNSFTVDFDEIMELSRDYNLQTGGTYTKMGFSPLWDDNFLYLTAVLRGASFREFQAGQKGELAQMLAWDEESLNRSMDFVYGWTHDINTDNQAVEDFRFKYFYEPAEKLVQNGRILFSYMESRDLFTLDEESKNNMDFRWISEEDTILISEDTVFLGIPKKAKSVKAAQAFILWFFRQESQQQLLEYSKTNRINENVFGICGGFSSLIPVTEQIYPRYYPELLGRMPPSDLYLPPNIMPANWAVLKERVILPYLNERARTENGNDMNTLEKRLADWLRMNR